MGVRAVGAMEGGVIWCYSSGWSRGPNITILAVLELKQTVICERCAYLTPRRDL